jgi:hypothetical protein
MTRFYASEPSPPKRWDWRCWLLGCEWDWSHAKGDDGEAAMERCRFCGALRAKWGSPGPCRCLHYPCQCEFNGFAGVADG